MSYPNEQIGRDKRIIKTRPRTMRWLKRQTAKLRRRVARRLLDEAPRQARYKGWWG